MLLIGVCGLSATPAAQGVRIAISCGAVGVELELCREGVSAWEELTGNRVEIVSTPNSSTERLALYQQMLAAGANDIDVFQIDIVWPGILGGYFIDLAPYADDEPARHFPQLIANDTVEGKLVALPWWTDAGVLFYRRDLLEKHDFDPPETWAELTAIAGTVQQAEREAGENDLWGYVWQGRAYEGLTCNGLEWIDAFGGGTIVADDGTITVNNPRAAEALDLAASWIGTISPRGVLNYDEEAARGVFQSGRAVFMRNWPYAWSLAQGEDSPVRGKVGVVALPSGSPDGQRSACLGGWHLAVSRFSDHPAEATDLALFLTSAERQKVRAVRGSYNPTRPALYEDAEVLAVGPFFETLYKTFENANPRPARATGTRYNRVSYAFSRAVHEILSEGIDPAPRLAELERDLLRLSRGGQW
ncbi:ABC transporter substrate-binding protein [Oceanibaculum nanhaiense]|uniref:ABC transporter substrate-binding protein n=1 Tax=Oceanibaculum nanhaiense TaxID=1909734 RepID=UPI003D2A225C